MGTKSRAEKWRPRVKKIQGAKSIKED